MDKIIIFIIILIISFYFIKKSNFGDTLTTAQKQAQITSDQKNSSIKTALNTAEAGYNEQMKVVISLNTMLSKLQTDINTATTNITNEQKNVNTATTNVSTATTANDSAKNSTALAEKDANASAEQSKKDVETQIISINSSPAAAQSSSKTKAEESARLYLKKLTALNLAKIASATTTIALEVANTTLKSATERLKVATASKVALETLVTAAQKNKEVSNDSLTKLLLAFNQINNLYKIKQGVCNGTISGKPISYTDINVAIDKCNIDPTCTGFTTSSTTSVTKSGTNINKFYQLITGKIKPMDPKIIADISSSCYEKK